MPEATKESDKKTPDSPLPEKTQPTNTPENQPTNEPSNNGPNPAYVESLERRLAEQQIQFRRMEQLIKSKEPNETTPPPKPPRNIEKEREEFYKDPVGRLEERLNDNNNRILGEMKKMLEPIQEVARGFKTNSAYDRIKADLKVDPLFNKAFSDPAIEPLLDRMVNSGSMGEINEDSVKSALAQIYGVRLMGGHSNNNNNNNNNNPSRVDPPEVPSNRVRITRDEPNKQELTEDDKTAMRYAGLKPGNPEHEKQYWDLIRDETMVLPVHKKKEAQ